MTKELHVPIVQAEKVSQSNTDVYPIVGIIPSDKNILIPDMNRSDQGDRRRDTKDCCDDCCEGCCSNDNDNDLCLCCCLLCLLNQN
jgi:hypothetical protein